MYEMRWNTAVSYNLSYIYIYIYILSSISAKKKTEKKRKCPNFPVFRMNRGAMRVFCIKYNADYIKHTCFYCVYNDIRVFHSKNGCFRLIIRTRRLICLLRSVYCVYLHTGSSNNNPPTN